MEDYLTDFKTTTNLAIQMDSTDRVVLSTESIKEKKKESFAPFSFIGICRRNNSRKFHMDIFDRLAVISKSATILFNDIKLKSDPKLGIAVMEVFENYDKVKMRSTYKRLSELRKIDLIQKIKKVRIKDPNIQDLDTLTIPTEKHSYMINPHLLKPKKYTYASSLWEALKKADGKQVFNPEQPIILPRNLYQGD